MPPRFFASKFKNTTPKPPKREETLTDLPVMGWSVGGDGVRSGASWVAFGIDGEGGKLGILPIDAKGRKSRHDLYIICAHPEPVSDFSFFPFDDRMLVTCSRDDLVKIWTVDENANIPWSTGEPKGRVSIASGHAEFLAMNPVAHHLFAVGAGASASVCDASVQSVALQTGDLGDRVQCGSWDGSGRLLAVGDRSKHVSIFDPRASLQPSMSTDSHQGLSKEGRVLFLGETGKLLTSGFSKARYRQLFLFDVRNIDKPVFSLDLDNSTGIVMPLYDPDTRLVFLAGKGSTRVALMELNDRSPPLTDVSVYNGAGQTFGACLVPKMALKVMEGEVGRLLQLSSNSINPISFFVPRKTYRDFLPELFPDTPCLIPGSTASDWLDGADRKPPKFSLDPAKRHLMNCEITPAAVESANDTKVTSMEMEESNEGGGVSSTSEYWTPSSGVSIDRNKFSFSPAEVAVQNGHPSPPKSDKMESGKPKPIIVEKSVEKMTKNLQCLGGEKAPTPIIRSPALRPNRPASSVLPLSSKFKYVVVSPGGKAGTFTNLRQVSSRLPHESDGFCVSSRWLAVPLSGPGGLVAVLDVEKPQKIPDGVLVGLENSVSVTDLAWCPFRAEELVVGCEDGTVNIWLIPDAGVHSLLQTPHRSFEAHQSKVLCLRYHPLAESVMATAGSDRNLHIWDLSCDTPSVRISLSNNDLILSMAWSLDGTQLATASKDFYVRLFKPIQSEAPVQESQVLESSRGARILFACKDSLLVLVSFNKSSGRVISLLNAASLSPVHTHLVDVAPQVLIPHYDPDTNVISLTGKGDRLIHMFEVVAESPWLLPLAAYMSTASHQALAFHQKLVCDVRRVEFARGWRLSNTSIESLSFTVPRVKTELFQSDIFPDAFRSWQAVGPAEQWFSGQMLEPELVSIKPFDMKHVEPRAATERPYPVAAIPELVSFGGEEAGVQESVVEAMSERMREAVEERPLEQAAMDGVDEAEWEDQ